MNLFTKKTKKRWHYSLMVSWKVLYKMCQNKQTKYKYVLMENIWTFIFIFLKDFYNFQFYTAIEYFFLLSILLIWDQIKMPWPLIHLETVYCSTQDLSYSYQVWSPLSICHSVSLVHIFTECLHASLNQKTEEGPNICDHQGIAERETTRRRKDTIAPVCLFSFVWT